MCLGFENRAERAGRKAEGPVCTGKKHLRPFGIDQLIPFHHLMEIIYFYNVLDMIPI